MLDLTTKQLTDSHYLTKSTFICIFLDAYIGFCHYSFHLRFVSNICFELFLQHIKATFSPSVADDCWISEIIVRNWIFAGTSRCSISYKEFNTIEKGCLPNLYFSSYYFLVDKLISLKRKELPLLLWQYKDGCQWNNNFDCPSLLFCNSTRSNRSRSTERHI